MALPLEGVQVLDLTRLLPGPFATRILADLGARVIKVEEPGKGDYGRLRPPLVDGVSYRFILLNHGKRSIALNLKSDQGREVFLRLARNADVLVESFRPGVMERLDLGYSALKTVNPGLIYCSISGFGQAGERSLLPGHDINYLAYSGVLAATGTPDGSPALPGIPFNDLCSSLYAALGIAVALGQRQRTGQGQYLDIAMLDSAVSLAITLADHYLGTWEVPRPGSVALLGRDPHYGVYRTRDGRHLALGCNEEKFWANLCRAIGAAELIDQYGAQGEARQRVRQRLNAVFAGRTQAEWMELLAGVDTCVAPVRGIDEALADAELKKRGVVLADREGRVALGTPLGFSFGAGTPGRAPGLGEDTAAVLQAAGYSPDEIDALAAAGAIALAGAGRGEDQHG